MISLFSLFFNGLLIVMPLIILLRLGRHSSNHKSPQLALTWLCILTAFLHAALFSYDEPSVHFFDSSKILTINLFAFLLFSSAAIFFLVQLLDPNILRRVSTWLLGGCLLISCLSLPSLPTELHLQALLFSNHWAMACFLVSLLGTSLWGFLTCTNRFRKEVDQIRRFQFLRILQNSAFSVILSLFVCFALPNISGATLPVYTWEMSNVLFLLQSTRVISDGEYLFLEHVARKAFIEMKKQQLEPSNIFHNFLFYLRELAKGKEPEALESLTAFPASDVTSQELEHLFCALSSARELPEPQFVVENDKKLPPHWLEGLHFSLDALQAENERLVRHIHYRKHASHGDANTIDLAEEILSLPTHTNPERLLVILERHMEESLRLYGQELVALSSAFQSAFHQAISLSRQSSPILFLGETGVGKKTIASAVHSYSSKNPLELITCDEQTTPEIISEVVQRIFQATDDDGFLLSHIDQLSPESAIRLLPLYLEKRTSKRRTPHVYLTSSENYLTLGENIDYYLYYRLRGAAVVLPPLRERPADIIAQFILFCTKYSQIPISEHSLSPALLQALVVSPWLRNSKELDEAAELYTKAGEQVFIDHLLSETTFSTESVGLSRATLLHFLRRYCYDREKAACHLGLPVADYERVAKKFNISAPSNFRRGVSA